jgi:hypothetical protein
MPNDGKPKTAPVPAKYVEAKPWERQRGESSEGFRLFCYFRDSTKRNLMEIAKELGVHRKKLDNYSLNWRWQERARAWDIELDRRVQKAQVGELVEMRKRHIALSMQMQMAAHSEMNALLEQIKAAEAEATTLGRKRSRTVLSMLDVWRLTEAGTKLERLSRGEYTEHTKVESDEDKFDFTRLTPEEAEAFVRIKAKLLSGG